MNEIDIKIGREVKKLVIESGIMQKDVAERLGIKKSSLSQMLSGKAPLPIGRFMDIMKIINVTDEKTIDKILSIYSERVIETTMNSENWKNGSLLERVKYEFQKKMKDNILFGNKQIADNGGINISGRNNGQGMTHIGSAESVTVRDHAFGDNILSEDEIRSDERKKILNKIMDCKEIDSEIRIQIYKLFNE